METERQEMVPLSDLDSNVHGLAGVRHEHEFAALTKALVPI